MDVYSIKLLVFTLFLSLILLTPAYLFSSSHLLISCVHFFSLLFFFFLYIDVQQLGLIILDTCSSDSYALNQSLEFVRASINTVEASAFQCSDGSIPRPKYGMKTISGVVGGSYSEVSLQVANLLRLFKIPQVTQSSTDPFSLFTLLTVPCDSFVFLFLPLIHRACVIDAVV